MRSITAMAIGLCLVISQIIMFICVVVFMAMLHGIMAVGVGMEELIMFVFLGTIAV